MSSKDRSPDTERRRHQRYHLPAGLRHGPLLTISDAAGNKSVVLNWSYGGLRLACGASSLPGDGNSTAAWSLRLHLTQEYRQDASVQIVGRSSETVSCSFIHSGPETLLFMRPWMERLRMGTSMVEMDSSVLKGELAKEGWQVWRGDGPVTLSVKPGKPGEHCDWRMVIPDQGAYAEIGATSSSLWQRKMVDPDERLSSRMTTTGEKDARISDAAIMILVGAMDAGLPVDHGLSLIDQLRAG